MSGFLEDLSDEQTARLREFRDMYKDSEMFNTSLLVKGLDSPSRDRVLLRFLRARQFDISKSDQMLKACLEWRREFGTETILEDFTFPEKAQVMSIYPHSHHGVDKLGRPVYIEKIGVLDIKKLFSITTLDRMLKYHVHEWEVLIHKKFPICRRLSGKAIETSLTILDLKGIGVKHINQDVIDMIKTVSKLDSDNYPEMLGKMFVLNAPLLFAGVWRIIKGFLDEKTRNKIEFLGSNYKTKLLEYVDADQLPQYLGGTCTCSPDCVGSNRGPWNDAKFVDMPRLSFVSPKSNEVAQENGADNADSDDEDEDDNEDVTAGEGETVAHANGNSPRRDSGGASSSGQSTPTSNKYAGTTANGNKAKDRKPVPVPAPAPQPDHEEYGDYESSSMSAKSNRMSAPITGASSLSSSPRSPRPASVGPPGCMMGWLFKRSRHLKTWNRRFFICKDQQLRYYRTECDDNPQGVLFLGPRVCIEDVGRAKNIYVISVAPHPGARAKEKVFMGSQQPAEMRMWKSLLVKEIEDSKHIDKNIRKGEEDGRWSTHSVSDADSADSGIISSQSAPSSAVKVGGAVSAVRRSGERPEKKSGTSTSDKSKSDEDMEEKSKSDEDMEEEDETDEGGADSDTNIPRPPPHTLRDRSQTFGVMPPGVGSVLPSLHAPDERWKLWKLENGLRIFESDDENIPSLKATCTVKATPDETFRLVMDLEALRTQWDITYDNGRVIEQLDKHADIVQMCLRPLWMWPTWTKPRDLVLMRYWRREPDGSYTILCSSTEHEGCPPSDTTVRANLIGGGFVISPSRGDNRNVEATSSVITCSLQIDPCGWIPNACGYRADFNHQILTSLAGLRYFLEQQTTTGFPGLWEPAPTAPSSPILAPTRTPPQSPPRQSRGDSAIRRSSSTIRDLLSSPSKPSPTAAAPGSPVKEDELVQVATTVTEEEDISKILVGTLKRSASQYEEHSWDEPDGQLFMVRGPTYLTTRKKIPSLESAFELAAIDFTRCDTPVLNVAARPGSLVQKLNRARPNTAPFSFVVNFQIPGMLLTLYFLADRSKIDDPVFNALLQKYIDGDDDFRNKRLKIIPSVVVGNYWVKKACGNKPAILGKAIKTSHWSGHNYVEASVDVNSSAVAAGILRVVKTYCKTLVIDLAFTIQGDHPEELPERILGAVRFSHINLDTVKTHVDDLKLDEE